jgi:serine/threonine protein kinase
MRLCKQEVMIVVVMELCQGTTLRQFLAERRGNMNKAEAVAIFEALAKAVREMHANGIIHRDIKPENVFISYDGEYKVQIVDFDLALVSDKPVEVNNKYSARMTSKSDSVLVGTAWYAAPEARSKIALAQTSDLHHLSQLDLFPLAITFIEMFLPNDTLMGRHKAIEQYRLTGHVPLSVRRACPECVPVLRRLHAGISAEALCQEISRIRQSVLVVIEEL